MQIIIFGKEACPFCVKAKDLSEKLCSAVPDVSYRYIDIRNEGITKADLEAKAGKEVRTVPQIFADDDHIGGFSEFEVYVKRHFGDSL